MTTSVKRIVLVVEDDIHALVALTRCLQTCGFMVIPTSNGLVALAVAGQDPPPDVIVCDLAMPVMTGIQLARMLRASPRTEKIPIIFLTGSESARDFADGMRSGEIVAYLHKPVELDELLAAINRAVQRKP